MQILTFRLKNFYFGILTENVIEITKTHDLKQVPKSPEWVEGLINLRGEVVTLVNMYSLLSINDFSIVDCYKNTIITKTQNNSIALMVDEVIGVYDIEEDDIQSTSDNENSFVSSLVTIDDQITKVLELNSLIEEIEGWV